MLVNFCCLAGLYLLLNAQFVALVQVIIYAGAVVVLFLFIVMLLGIERGFVEGECGFDLGLPSWLPLDQWFPAMFQVHTTCGYTPLLPLGFSMAEVLLPLSIILLLLSISLLLVTLVSLRSGRPSPPA
mgnify:CR=1 FL=1